jgi:hypothetical protein
VGDEQLRGGRQFERHRFSNASRIRQNGIGRQLPGELAKEWITGMTDWKIHDPWSPPAALRQSYHFGLLSGGGECPLWVINEH